MALKKTKYDLLIEIIDTYLADGTVGLAAIKAYVDTLEDGLGNPTGDMSAVAQGDAASLAAYLIQFKEHYRAHDQTRICLVIPGAALDDQNTAIKTELDKIGTVSVLTEVGVFNCQEDWAVYDIVVVGTDRGTPWTLIGNIDTLITLKTPVVVCCSSAAEELLMGTVAAQTAADLNEWCESVANRVMYKVFLGATGEKVLFSEAADSDRLNMVHADLTEEVLMVQATGDGNTLVVVGWLPMEEADGTINKLTDGNEIPAGRVFAGCFFNADKLTDLGKELLRTLCRNSAQASITPSITMKAQAALVAAIANDTNELQTDWTNGGRLDAILDLCALEATLTAIKGVGFATGTDSLKVLSDVLDAITAAGPTNTQMETARDAVIAAIPAMVGTNGAALAADWTGALATALAAYTAARGGYLEELAAANIPADVDGLKTSRDRQLFSEDFWSIPQIAVVIPAGAATQTLPDVIVDIPAGATVVKATAMFMFRMLDNAGAANKLSGAQHIQIQKGAGAFGDAISLVDDQFGIGEATREGGTLVVGDHNVAATVTADETYGFQWLDALADVAGLTFNDLQMGIRVWYSV